MKLLNNYFQQLLDTRNSIRLDSSKLLEIGIKPGPIYGKLKAGQEVEWEGKVLIPFLRY